MMMTEISTQEGTVKRSHMITKAMMTEDTVADEAVLIGLTMIVRRRGEGNGVQAPGTKAKKTERGGVLLVSGLEKKKTNVAGVGIGVEQIHRLIHLRAKMKICGWKRGERPLWLSRSTRKVRPAP